MSAQRECPGRHSFFLALTKQIAESPPAENLDSVSSRFRNPLSSKAFYGLKPRKNCPFPRFERVRSLLFDSLRTPIRRLAYESEKSSFLFHPAATRPFSLYRACGMPASDWPLRQRLLHHLRPAR